MLQYANFPNVGLIDILFEYAEEDDNKDADDEDADDREDDDGKRVLRLVATKTQ